MPALRPTPTGETRAAVARSAGWLGAQTVLQMETDHAWYRGLAPEHRSWVGLVAQAGIQSFVTWLEAPSAEPIAAAEVFGTAPAELTRAISLAQTLDLLRTAIAVVEREIATLAGPDDADAALDAVLRYGREVAFAAARVYAETAEARGAWDARLESLVVDAVIRGDADDSMRSRAAALGWGSIGDVVVVVGSTPPPAVAPPTQVVADLHLEARRLGHVLLVAIHSQRVICIAGSVSGPADFARALDRHLGDGALVIGPTVPHLFAAGRSARAAISGHEAAPLWPGAPRPTFAEDLLAERALLGDQPARGALMSRIIAPLRDSPGESLLDTAAAFLDGGLGIEGTARALYVHANTVRYRLAKIAKSTGYDLSDAHDAQTVRVALAYSRAQASTNRRASR